MSQNPLLDLLDAVASSTLDANPIGFRPQDEDGVEPVAQACRGLSQVVMFDEPLNRNAFLCGCLDLLEHQPIEHLIVGFGHRQGSTTKVRGLAHVVGQAGQVSIPGWVVTAARKTFASDFKAEVLWLHNHPMNGMNRVLDNAPIASVQDRKTLVNSTFEPTAITKLIASGGQMRFYVVENGFVREFTTPPVVTVARGVHRWLTP